MQAHCGQHDKVAIRKSQPVYVTGAESKDGAVKFQYLSNCPLLMRTISYIPNQVLTVHSKHYILPVVLVVFLGTT